MSRPLSWRPLLAAAAYVAATLAVLLLGAALMTSRFNLLRGDRRAVVLFLGAALLLLGAGRLIYRAVRSMTQQRGR